MDKGVRLGADRVAVAMDLVEQVRRLVQAVVTDVDVLFLHALRSPYEDDGTLEKLDTSEPEPAGRRLLTLAVGVEVQDAAGGHHRLQRDDLVQRHPEQLVLVEPPRWGVMRLMRAEVVMPERKPLPPLG